MEDGMRGEAVRIGEVARRTGVTVRALRHYDEIGLLTPSGRTEAGHRLYAAGDLARLQQILSLRQIGFGLEEAREFLSRPEVSPGSVLRLHLSRLREQIEARQKLCRRLEAAAKRYEAAGAVPVEEFLRLIEVTAMVEKIERYYTPEQLAELAERRQAYGEEYMRQVEAEWPALIAQAREEMGKGTDPASEPVLKIARRWKELVEEFTGGNPEIRASLNRMYENEPEVRRTNGLDPELMEYVGRAIAALE